MKNQGFPSDSIPVITVEGREYGQTKKVMHEEAKFSQEIPPILMELAVQLRENSALLALTAVSSNEKQVVLDAYAKDLALLQRYTREFDECAREAVRQSIIGEKEKADELWTDLKNQMPVIGRAPLLELSYTRAAKEAPILLEELKEEFKKGVGRVLRLFAYWLQVLVEEEFLGLVEWAPGTLDVCRYHYFRHDRRDHILKDEVKTTREFDGSRPYGNRNIETKTRERQLRRDQFLERHVHHIVGVKLHRLDDYPKAVPERIRWFINAVPKWLRPLLQVVEGTITMEEVLRRQVGSTIVQEHEVLSVNKYSPTIALGSISLIGWSGDDLHRQGVGYFWGQTGAKAEKRKNFLKISLRAALCTLAVISSITGIVYLVRLDESEKERVKAQAHAAYMSSPEIQAAAAMEYSIKPGETLKLPYRHTPSLKIRLSRDNSGTGGGDILEIISDGTATNLPHAVRRFRLEPGNNISFGDVDLGEFGHDAKLHVIQATKENFIYRVTRY